MGTLPSHANCFVMPVTVPLIVHMMPMMNLWYRTPPREKQAGGCLLYLDSLVLQKAGFEVMTGWALGGWEISSQNGWILMLLCWTVVASGPLGHCSPAVLYVPLAQYEYCTNPNSLRKQVLPGTRRCFTAEKKRKKTNFRLHALRQKNGSPPPPATHPACESRTYVRIAGGVLFFAPLLVAPPFRVSCPSLHLASLLENVS